MVFIPLLVHTYLYEIYVFSYCMQWTCSLFRNCRQFLSFFLVTPYYAICIDCGKKEKEHEASLYRRCNYQRSLHTLLTRMVDSWTSYRGLILLYRAATTKKDTNSVESNITKAATPTDCWVVERRTVHPNFCCPVHHSSPFSSAFFPSVIVVSTIA